MAGTPVQQTTPVAASGGPRFAVADAVVLSGCVAMACAAVHVAHEWAGHFGARVAIDLSPRALPGYTLLSLSRGLVAYLISLAFTLVYAFWAAKHRPSGRLLIPILDILQSIPVLGFMPGLVLGLIAVFPPGSNLGLELAAVLMIFTGQVWNMTFSFHRSLTSLPKDQDEAARVFRYGWWQRLRWVELPFATTGLVWNSMMSMAGGWFFLMVSESFTLGDKDFRLPGVGSYMQEALGRGDWTAMAWGIAAMVLMIVALDQLLWRPLVVWAQRFRVEETAGAPVERSWFLDLLQRSLLLRRLGRRLGGRRAPAAAAPPLPDARVVRDPAWGRWLAWGAFTLLVLALAWGGGRLFGLLAQVPLHVPAGAAAAGVAISWGDIWHGCGLTALRVLGAVALGTLWALPVGLAIGGSPTWSRRLQPVVQVAASFPAPMLFPLCLMLFQLLGIPLGIGSVGLMLLGTQWYILFNVIAGAQAIPSDLREAATAFRLRPWQRRWSLEIPAVFPALVTGWVTAAGGAWNASIVAEYLTWHGQVHATDGLGATISRAAERADYPALAAAVTCMAVAVVAINFLFWRRLHELAQGRFSLSK